MNHASNENPPVPTATQTAPTAATAAAPAVPTEPAKPTMTKDQVNAMLAAYVHLDNEVNAAAAKVAAAEEVLNQAKQRRSDLCQTLMTDGPGKGYYKIQGQNLELTSRKVKGSDKVTYYFRGERDTKVLGGD